MHERMVKQKNKIRSIIRKKLAKYLLARAYIFSLLLVLQAILQDHFHSPVIFAANIFSARYF